MEQTTKYTVFFEEGEMSACNVNINADLDLHGLIEYWRDQRPAAWAPELISSFGGAKRCRSLRAESIAAGRTIELVDGKYVPRGLPIEEKPAALFRIGGVYRMNGGRLSRIVRLCDNPNPESHYFLVSRMDSLGNVIYEDDGSRYIDGSYFGDKSDEASLLPGELIQRDGQWVAVEEKPAQGAADHHAEDVRRAIEIITGIPSKRTAEKQHPRLTWADSKPADRWAGYTVKKGSLDQPHPPTNYLPDGVGEFEAFRFGSAELLKVR